MYTSIDLLENKKMDEIIKINKEKIRCFNLKKHKKDKIETIIANILMTVSCSIFFIGLMYFIAVIENVRF